MSKLFFLSTYAGFVSIMVTLMSLIDFFTSQEGVWVKPPRLSI